MAATVFGLDPAPPPVLTAQERQYLVGFLAGVHAGVPGVPVLPPDAPFSPEHALWVNGTLAGMYSRAAATQPSATLLRREVVILWASQTGNAEEFAAATAERLTTSGHSTSMVGMDQADLGELPPGADLLLITSTFGDGDAPDNGSGFWETLADPGTPAWRVAGTPCWPSATRRTTTSAGTAAVSTSASTNWARCGWPRARTASRTSRTRRTAGWTRF